MNRFLILLIIVVLILISHTGCSNDISPNAVPVFEANTYSSRIGSKEYDFEVSSQLIDSSQEWSFDQKMPVTMEDAVAIAKKDIDRYDKDNKLWVLSRIELSRLGITNKWFYIVQFDKRMGINSDVISNDYLMIPVLFNGKTIKGE